MSSSPQSLYSQADTKHRDSRLSRLLRGVWRFTKSTPIAAVGSIILISLVFAAVFAEQVAPYSPLETHYDRVREAPSRDHLFGTDSIGRDVLSRIIYGAQISLTVGIGAVLIGDLIGITWGVTSGYIGNRFDLISQRFLDVLLAFPGLVLAMMFVLVLGSGVPTVVIAIAVTMIPASTRVTRSVAMSVKELSYVEAATVVGASSSRIMLRHIAPQCIAAFLVVATAHFGIAITVEAALSFLGIGIAPPTPSWGTMLGGATASMFSPPWWLAVFPGAAITVTVLSANMVGDAVRDILDPNLSGRMH